MLRKLLFLVLVFVTIQGKDYYYGTKVANENVNETYLGKAFPEFESVAVFLEPLVQVLETGRCKQQVTAFLENLRNSSLWAVQMFDASAKLPQGFLTSDPYDLGNYDGCLEINLNRRQEDNIMGKHCLARFKVSGTTCHDEPMDLFQNSDLLTFKNLIVPVRKFGIKNGNFRLGVCVPHECNSVHIENLLRFLYNNITSNGCQIEVEVPEDGCMTAGATNAFFGILIRRILLGMFFGVILITILEVTSITYKFEIPGILQRFILPFSAYKNYKWLVSAHESHRLPVIDSLKVYVVILLTAINRFQQLLRGPIVNRQSIDYDFNLDFRTRFFDITFSTVAVTLLTISGFLHYHKIYNLTKVHQSVGTLRIVLLQILKMLPLYLTAAIFYGFAYESLGDGPLWKERAEVFTLRCRQSFLGNFLNLTTYLNITENCIHESWYFMVVAPHFLILPLIHLLTVKSSTTGSIALGFLTGVTLLMPFRTTYNATGVYTGTNDFSDEVRRQQLSLATMNQTFTYFIGAVAGVVYNGPRGRKKRSSQICLKVYALSTMVSYVALFSVGHLGNQPQAKNIFRSVVDVPGQLTLSLVVSWVIVNVSQNRSYLAPLLFNKYLSFFGSFTYPYVLILGLVQRYTTGTTRTIDYFSLPRLIWMSAADLAATYIFAFVFFMMIHRPATTMLEAKLLHRMVEFNVKEVMHAGDGTTERKRILNFGSKQNNKSKQKVLSQ